MASAEAIDGLPRATPESRNVASASISDFLNDARTRNIELNSFLLYRNGAVISEGWWYPYQPHFHHMMHSATKSFLSVAIGMAIEEGFFSLQDKVVAFFPDHVDADKMDSKMAALTVEDLLTQTSGHATGASGGTWRSVKTSWIAEFFKIPVVHQPGTFFKYTSATSFLLSAIIHRTTGQSTFQFLMPRLFQALGIRDLKWDTGPDGINAGGNGISCRPSDLLKLSILHLNGGTWDSKRLLSADWVRQATSPQRGNEYGYHWWTEKGQGSTYYAYGLFGQFAVVFPEHGAALVTTASAPMDERKLRSLIWRHFPSMFQGQPGKRDDAGLLPRQLRHLRIIPSLPMGSARLPPRAPRRTVFFAAPNVDRIAAFSLEFGGHESCIFHVQDDRGLHRVIVGLTDWMDSETTVSGAALHHGYEPGVLRVSAYGSYLSEHTFVMHWQFTETAFRDVVSVTTARDGETAVLERGVNVNSFATQRPPVHARRVAEDRFSPDCSIGTIFRQSGVNAAAVDVLTSFPQRVIPLSLDTASLGELLDAKEVRAVLLQELGGEVVARCEAPNVRPYTLATIAERWDVVDAKALERIRAELEKCRDWKL